MSSLSGSTSSPAASRRRATSRSGSRTRTSSRLGTRCPLNYKPCITRTALGTASFLLCLTPFSCLLMGWHGTSTSDQLPLV